MKSSVFGRRIARRGVLRVSCCGSRQPLTEIARDYDALAFAQCRPLRFLVELRQRPNRHMVSRCEQLQGVAGMSRDCDAGVPKLDRPASGKDDAQRDSFTLPACTHRPHFGSQQLLNAAELVQIDVDDFATVFEIVARVVPMKARARSEIATTQNIR